MAERLLGAIVRGNRMLGGQLLEYETCRMGSIKLRQREGKSKRGSERNERS
jgi:hypothetical protein